MAPVRRRTGVKVRGITAWGAYLPHHRLERRRIGETLAVPSMAGTRSVASHDEDTTTMAVAAAREALATVEVMRTDICFATATPAYLDKTNATAVHAALGLPPDSAAFDTGGALRSGIGTLRFALEGGATTLALMADLRTGHPGGTDEAEAGDAACGFLISDDDAAPVLAELTGAASFTVEFMDRWRLPGEPVSRVWEERFGERVYKGIVEPALTDALKAAGVTLDEVDHLVVTGTHARAVRSVIRALAPAVAAVDDLTSIVGNTGTAHAGLLLAATLDVAQPDQVIVVVSLQDGVDAIVLRTTQALAQHRRPTSVADQLTRTSTDLTYARFLTWRGMLEPQGPRRPDPTAPSAPPAYRATTWKFGLTGTRDRTSGTVALPPQRVSDVGATTDDVDPIRMMDVPARIATFSVDRLAHTLDPPAVTAVVDFDGGGRFVCEVTDVDAATISIGDQVEMTFRRMYTAQGVHNYFWKARPVRLPPTKD